MSKRIYDERKGLWVSAYGERRWFVGSVDVEDKYWAVEVTDGAMNFIAHDYDGEARFTEWLYAQYFGEEVVDYYESKGKDVTVRVVYVNGESNE